MFRCTSFLALVLISTVYSGFHIGIGGGYGFSAGGVLGQNIESSHDDNSEEFGREWIFASYGNGFKIDVDACYFVNDNFGIMFASGYGLMGGWTSKRHYVSTLLVSGYSATTKYESGYFPLNLGVKFKTGFDNISPYIYVAPGLYFPSLVSTHTTTQSDSKTERTYHFNTGLGVASGLGVITFTSMKMGIKIELFSNYAYASINERTTSSTGSPSTDVIKYVDKPEKDLAADESNELIQHTFSSVGVKLGVVVVF